ncbi:DUF7504 family protein [Halobellus clavatus]|jgi:hypothetical protein|uniref:KaiC protein n=1 Tax=Halobellus clavatus TaxID=660517 RepID=A0A1H3FP80_9EURY|nr:hypothetical protein [Halobellus clavatus]SDX92188.1 hypothetical protein SAMN04487946_10459 [Halobellus clavatus]
MPDDEEDASAVDDRSSSLSDLVDDLNGDSGTDRDPSTDRQSLSELADSIRRRGAERGSGDSSGGEWDLVSDDTRGNESLDPKTEAVLELTGEASNVLLSGPSDVPVEQSLCSRLMSSARGEPVNLLVIAITKTPSQRLSVLENYLSDQVAKTAVVDVRNYDREINYEQYDGPVDIRTVPSPQDLRRIGIVTSKVLTDWEGAPGETTLCFHSLSDLLRLNEDRQRVFRFLHVLRGRVRSAGARAHFHFDPDRLDDQDIGTFESLFDTVLQFDEDGSISLL